MYGIIASLAMRTVSQLRYAASERRHCMDGLLVYGQGGAARLGRVLVRVLHRKNDAPVLFIFVFGVTVLLGVCQ